MKAANQCSFRFVFGSIVRFLVCVRVQLEQNHWYGDLFLAGNVSLRCNFPAHVYGAHFFVALQNHRIEKTVGLEVTWTFSRQIFVSTFPGARDAGNRSTA